MSEEIWNKDSVVTRATWEKREDSPEERVFRHCFHHRETCEIVEEAENVIILHEKNTRLMSTDEGVLHIWVYTRGNWSSCFMTPPSVWNAKSVPEKLAHLKSTLDHLRQMPQ